jgi:hypothetical protein
MEASVINHGQEMAPYGDEGPKVRAIPVDKVRAEFISAYPADNEDQRARDSIKRTAFHRALKDARERLLICSRDINGTDFVWLVNETELDYLKRMGG